MTTIGFIIHIVNYHIDINMKNKIGRKKDITIIVIYSEHRLLDEREIYYFLTMR